MNKFWKWKKQKVINQDGGKGVERVLELRGTIASESWYDDDITPKMRPLFCFPARRSMQVC